MPWIQALIPRKPLDPFLSVPLVPLWQEAYKGCQMLTHDASVAAPVPKRHGTSISRQCPLGDAHVPEDGHQSCGGAVLTQLQIHGCCQPCLVQPESHSGPSEGGSCCKLQVQIQRIILGFQHAAEALAINFLCSLRSQGFSTLFISLGKSHWWLLSYFLIKLMIGIT